MFTYKSSLLFTVFFSLNLAACSSPLTQGSNLNAAASKHQKPKKIVELGQLIFEDTRLSEPQGMACASCHAKEQAFTGNNRSSLAAIAAGALPNTFGNRNSPTAMYAAFSPSFQFAEEVEDGVTEFVPNGGQFWDGRADNLVEQAKGPFLNAREMNNPSKASVVEKIKNGPYTKLFEAVFGKDSLADTDKAYSSIAEAIAAFETEKLSPFSSKFDAVLKGRARFTQLEAKGFALFQDPEKGNCIACHAGKPESKNPKDWLFTDFTYDNLGVPRNAAIPDNQDASFFDLGLCQQSGLALRAPQGFELETLCGAFKVPTLRNVAVTGPYMHNGAFKTLRDVVKFYVTRDTSPELWYPKDQDGNVLKFNDLPLSYQGNVNSEEAPYDRKLGDEPRLNENEIDAVVAFLKTLTDR